MSNPPNSLRRERDRATSSRKPNRGSAPPFRRWLWPIGLCAIGIAAYANSFHGVFLYDDVHHILQDERIHTLWPLKHLWANQRPIVMFSLAVNYAVGNLDPWGYHLFNLIVHLLAGLTLFGLIRRTLRLPRFAAWTANRADGIAFLAAALWLVHPLQTQSVTYVIQRGESLMGLFYLLTLYAALRAESATKTGAIWGWSISAIIACALGMTSKPVMISAPIMVVLFDWVFRGEPFSTVVRRRWPLYTALFATWAILVALGVTRGTFDPAEARPVMGFGFKGVTPRVYLMTQAQVIVHYLRLSVWPDRLCLDYGWPFVESLRAVILPGLFIVCLLVFTVYGVARRRWYGFLGAWFFLILAPTSSIIPIQDAAYEHRMYLPLASITILIVVGGQWLLRKISEGSAARRHKSRVVAVTAFVIALIALGARTVARNRDYSSALAMWGSVAAQRPDHARAQYNFGNALRDTGDLDGAMERYRRAIELEPRFAHAQNNLGNALRIKGDIPAAIEHFRAAIAARPNFADAHTNLGVALAGLGRTEEAIELYREACRLDPDNGEAFFNLANALGKLGRYEETLGPFEQAIGRFEREQDMRGALAQAHFGLGTTLRFLGREAEAQTHLAKARQLSAEVAQRPGRTIGDGRARP